MRPFWVFAQMYTLLPHRSTLTSLIVVKCLSGNGTMRAQRGKSLLIAGGVVALIVIAAIAALLCLTSISSRQISNPLPLTQPAWMSGSRGRWGSLSFPLAYRLRIFISPTRERNHFPRKPQAGGGVAAPAEEAAQSHQLRACQTCRHHREETLMGRYNFESTEKKSTERRPEASFRLNNLKLSKGVLVYLDKKTGEKTDMKDFNLSIKDLSVVDTQEIS